MPSFRKGDRVIAVRDIGTGRGPFAAVAPTGCEGSILASVPARYRVLHYLVRWDNDEILEASVNDLRLK